jgi:hypothetical protein
VIDKKVSVADIIEVKQPPLSLVASAAGGAKLGWNRPAIPPVAV